MEHLIVEQSFALPPTQEEEHNAARRIDACLERFGARWMRSYVSLDRLRMVCEFEAPDAESVRTAYHTAGVHFDRVWTANVYARVDTPSVVPAAAPAASSGGA
jgi:hypothetical protein